MRSLGVCLPENQARVLTRPTVSSLGPTFGRGGDDQWLGRHQEPEHDVIMGGNPAEVPPLRIQMGH